MLDRLDIFVDVPRVDYDKLTDDRLGESSAEVRARVEAAAKFSGGALREQGLVAMQR